MPRSNVPFTARAQSILETIAERGHMTVNIKWCPQLVKSDVVGRDLKRMIKAGMLVAKREGCSRRGKPSKSYTVLKINPNYKFKYPIK